MDIETSSLVSHIGGHSQHAVTTKTVASTNAPSNDRADGFRIPVDEVKNVQKCAQKDFQADFNPGGIVTYKAPRPLCGNHGSTLRPASTGHQRPRLTATHAAAEPQNAIHRGAETL